MIIQLLIINRTRRARKAQMDLIDFHSKSYTIFRQSPLDPSSQAERSQGHFQPRDWLVLKANFTDDVICHLLQDGSFFETLPNIFVCFLITVNSSVKKAGVS